MPKNTGRLEESRQKGWAVMTWAMAVFSLTTACAESPCWKLYGVTGDRKYLESATPPRGWGCLPTAFLELGITTPLVSSSWLTPRWFPTKHRIAMRLSVKQVGGEEGPIADGNSPDDGSIPTTPVLRTTTS